MLRISQPLPCNRIASRHTRGDGVIAMLLDLS